MPQRMLQQGKAITMIHVDKRWVLGPKERDGLEDIVVFCRAREE